MTAFRLPQRLRSIDRLVVISCRTKIDLHDGPPQAVAPITVTVTKRHFERRRIGIAGTRAKPCLKLGEWSETVESLRRTGTAMELVPLEDSTASVLATGDDVDRMARLMAIKNLCRYAARPIGSPVKITGNSPQIVQSFL